MIITAPLREPDFALSRSKTRIGVTRATSFFGRVELTACSGEIHDTAFRVHHARRSEGNCCDWRRAVAVVE